METVTISARFMVVIPKVFRERLGLSPGQKLQAVRYGNRIELIPLQQAKRLRGFLKGIDTTVPREHDREMTSSTRFADWNTSPTVRTRPSLPGPSRRSTI
jgi:AbrB family looped-hinge helix DNA binding protein